MRLLVATLASLAVLACGAKRDPLPQNASTATPLRLDPKQPLGWLALASAPEHGDAVPAYAPTNATYPLVTRVAPKDLPRKVSVLGVSAGIAEFAVGPAAEIEFGCESNLLEVTTLAGPWLTPGVAWILPPSRPANWKPEPLSIVSREATPTARTYAIGPHEVVLTRTSDRGGTLSIVRDGRTIHTEAFERHPMEGADTTPIDLTVGGPGIPEPVAAWSIAPDGPILLVVLQPGYEGVTLSPLLVELDSARTLDALQTYLYYCAF